MKYIDDDGVGVRRYIDDDAVEVLDELIHTLYTNRVILRDKDDREYWNIDYTVGVYARLAKKVARAFGLYPYNQEVIKQPTVSENPMVG